MLHVEHMSMAAADQAGYSKINHRTLLSVRSYRVQFCIKQGTIGAEPASRHVFSITKHVADYIRNYLT